jgi:alanyl-tRNA synthetase
MALSGTLSGSAIREKFLRFFADKHGHRVVPSASLVPTNPTVLLTPAGMLPFVPIFMGIEQAPNPPRNVSCQKCARVSGKASDLANVGVTPRHHTFFEMLGNFSFGDYFKREAITWAWDFITNDLKLPKERLWLTVYHEDEEARQIWQEMTGFPASRIIGRGKKDNFWGPPGPTGPCGPCSEIFFDRGGEPTGSPESDEALLDTDRFVEIWNLVFMELFQDDAGKTTPLANKNVDTGMGLERIAMVIQGKDNTFETDLLYPIIDHAAKLSSIPYKKSYETDVALKIVADHSRCLAMALSDGIVPSNEGRGYIIRMILRRAVRYGKKYLGFSKPFLYQLIAIIRNHYQDAYPELKTRYNHIVETIQREEERFFETLERGSKRLDEVLESLRSSGQKCISGDDAFKLYDTYGFPLELTVDIALEEGFTVDEAGFETAMQAQKVQARGARGKAGEAIVKDNAYGEIFDRIGATNFHGYDTLSEETRIVALLIDGQSVDEVSGVNQPFDAILESTPFYAESGGQIGDRGSFSREEGPHGVTVVVNDTVKVGELFVHKCLFDNGDKLRVGETVLAQVDPVSRHQSAIHHTAVHLLQGALRQVLGDSIVQAGSKVSPEAGRFDFTFPRGLTRDELNRVEFLMNHWIQQNMERSTRLMPIEEAKLSGALLMAGEKYADEVRVISYGGVSSELCGGTHAKSLGDIALVKIVSEGAIAAGIRRIEIVAGEKAYKQFKILEADLRDISETLKAPMAEVPGKIAKLLEELKQREKLIQRLEEKSALAEIKTIQAAWDSTKPIYVKQMDGLSPDTLKSFCEKLARAVGPHVIVLAGDFEGKAVIVVSVSPEWIAKGFQAGKLVKTAAQLCGGGGDGKPAFAQAGGKDPSQIPVALEAVNTELSALA